LTNCFAQPGRWADLCLSDSAVEKHINSIFAKLGLRQESLVHHRVKAVLAYLVRR
jgi:DNA-binding NarL/FixJ family response regulator